MPTNARARHRIGTGGPWGTGLLILGLAVLVQGIGYTTATRGRLPSALEALSEYVPPYAWGCLWIVAGAFSIFWALTPPQRHWQVSPVVGVLCLWSAAYFLYWLAMGFGHGVWTRSWSAAVGWGMLAGLIICWSRCVNPPIAVIEQ